jgi:hypothetical protein
MPSWAIGTGIPPEILGPTGYLGCTQACIEDLTIITDGACEDDFDNDPTIDLSAFTDLRKLSWTGLRSNNDMYALAEVLKQRSHQFLKLELDFIDVYHVEDLGDAIDSADVRLAQCILGLLPGNKKCVFPVLQELSLFNNPFQFPAATDLAYAFNFSLLLALRLCYCEGWEAFILKSKILNRPSQLQSLEIQSHLQDDDDFEESVSHFLNPFQGLKKLALSVASPVVTDMVWEALLNHQSTLRVFVYHQEGMSYVPDTPCAPEDVIEWSVFSSREHLLRLDLEFLGIRCRPELVMVSICIRCLLHAKLTPS